MSILNNKQRRWLIVSTGRVQDHHGTYFSPKWNLILSLLFRGSLTAGNKAGNFSGTSCSGRGCRALESLPAQDCMDFQDSHCFSVGPSDLLGFGFFDVVPFAMVWW